MSEYRRLGATSPGGGDAPGRKPSFLYTLFFGIMAPILSTGKQRPLQVADLPPAPHEESAAHWNDLVTAAWRQETARATAAGGRPSLWRVIRRLAWRTLAFSGAIYLAEFLPFVQVFCLSRLVAYLGGEASDHLAAFFYLLLLCAAAGTSSITEPYGFFTNRRLGMFLQSGVSTLLYAKTLRLPMNTSKGAVMTLVATDCIRIRELMENVHNLWLTPLCILAAIGYCFVLLGPAAVGALAVAVVMVPVSWRVTTRFEAVQDALMNQQQARMRRFTEVLQGMLIIKLFSWEHSAARRVQHYRKQELGSVLAFANNISYVMTIIWSASTLMAVATFTLYYLMGHTLTASVVFPSLFLFNFLTFPMLELPYTIGNLMGTMTSVRRIEDFLLRPEVATTKSGAPPRSTTHGFVGLPPSGGPPLTSASAAPPPPPVKGAPGGVVAAVNNATLYWTAVEKDDDEPADDDVGCGDLARACVGRLGCCGGGGPAPASAGLLSEDLEVGGGTLAAPALINLSLAITEGSLVAVVGPVGAGKTSLLNALLGELRTHPDGDGGLPVALHTDVVFAPQQPWIRSATIRSNIVVGAAFDDAVYGEVLDVCALRPDVALFTAGDQTEVGENGITLSGGQKARLSLARVVYRVLTAPAGARFCCLLDDPLSAVDAHVGDTLFHKAVVGVLKARGHGVVLVTHQLQFLPGVDRVVVMERGGVAHDGTYDALVASGVQFASLDSGPASSGVPSPALESKEAPPPSSSPPTSALPPPLMHPGVEASLASLDKLSLVRHTSDEFDEDGALAEVVVTPDAGEVVQHGDAPPAGKLIEEEERFTGTIGWPVFKMYFASLGTSKYLVLLAAVSLALEAAKAGNVMFLSVWSHAEAQSGVSGAAVPTGAYLGGFVALGLLTAVLSLGRNLMFFRGAVAAATRLHDRMFGAILRSPFAFFSVTPQGRILNRFSKDQNSVDQHLPDLVSDMLLAGLEVVTRIITILIATPFFAVAVPVIFWAYRGVANTYRASSRELQRLNSITSSPVHSLFGESVDGLTTMRAFGLEGSEVVELLRRTEVNNRVFTFFVMANCWMTQRVRCISVGVVAVVGCLSIFARVTGASWLMGSAAMLPLSVTYAISLTDVMAWVVRVSTKAEAEMSRVERMKHYAALPPEAPLSATPPAGDYVTEGTPPEAYARVREPPPAWPTSGALVFRDVVMAYRQGLPTVLNGVNFRAAHGEKIGIVGRTGAGKSSILMALFRIVDDLRGGSITLDGVDLSTIGLRDARRAVALVPQDPVLFSGTVRSNLTGVDATVAAGDPTPDGVLWDTLAKCGMQEYVTTLPGQLDAAVDEGGQNFSVGQRQLLSLGRAILRNAKVLVLDEATSSIDLETDNCIQATIRDTFADATILTIAHRLPTVLSYDKILVLDAGRVVEFDHAHRLLSMEGGVLAGMVDSTGPESAAALRRQARLAYQAKAVA